MGENLSTHPDIVPPEVADGTSEDLLPQTESAVLPKARRLVPDFDPGVSAPGSDPHPNSRFFLESKVPHPSEMVAAPADPEKTGRRWWALFAALILVAGVAWFGLRLQGISGVPPGTPSPENRPLGLYVDPTAESWRISWNRDATALPEARETRLLVKDGEEQNLIDLTPEIIAASSTQFTPKGRDVTFRMESTAKDGKVTAESFRILRPAAENPKPAPRAASSVPSDLTPPKAIHRVAPVVAGSVRPRIKGKVPIDIRAEIDSKGRVTNAVALTKPREALEVYLTERALRAAKEWRFDPARKDGKRIPGSQVIHFVFER